VARSALGWLTLPFGDDRQLLTAPGLGRGRVVDRPEVLGPVLRRVAQRRQGRSQDRQLTGETREHAVQPRRCAVRGGGQGQAAQAGEAEHGADAPRERGGQPRRLRDLGKAARGGGAEIVKIGVEGGGDGPGGAREAHEQAIGRHGGDSQSVASRPNPDTLDGRLGGGVERLESGGAERRVGAGHERPQRRVMTRSQRQRDRHRPADHRPQIAGSRHPPSLGSGDLGLRDRRDQPDGDHDQRDDGSQANSARHQNSPWT
jgi:hypothetical protein